MVRFEDGVIKMFPNQMVLVNGKSFGEIDARNGFCVGPNTILTEVSIGINDLNEIALRTKEFLFNLTIEEFELSVTSQVQLHDMNARTVSDLFHFWKQLRQKLNQNSITEIEIRFEILGLPLE